MTKRSFIICGTD